MTQSDCVELKGAGAAGHMDALGQTQSDCVELKVQDGDWQYATGVQTQSDCVELKALVMAAARPGQA